MRVVMVHRMNAIVHHRCQADEILGTVTGVMLDSGGGVKYRVSWGNSTEGLYYGCELVSTDPAPARGGFRAR